MLSSFLPTGPSWTCTESGPVWPPPGCTENDVNVLSHPAVTVQYRPALVSVSGPAHWSRAAERQLRTLGRQREQLIPAAPAWSRPRRGRSAVIGVPAVIWAEHYLLGCVSSATCSAAAPHHRLFGTFCLQKYRTNVGPGRPGSV